MSLNSAFSSADSADAKARISGSVTGTVNFSFGRPSAKSTYMSNGHRMNSQIAANNAGALTRAEASRMGLPLGGRR